MGYNAMYKPDIFRYEADVCALWKMLRVQNKKKRTMDNASSA